MRKILLFWISLLLSLSAMSQSAKNFAKGHLVLQNGESKVGEVALQAQRKPGVYYQANAGTEIVFFSIGQVKELRIGDQERYIAHCSSDSIGNTSCQWLLTLVECQVSLYRTLSGSSFYLLEEAGQFFSIRVNTLLGVV